MAKERPDLSSRAMEGDVGPIVCAYLADAGGDPCRALVATVTDALLERDAWAMALCERDRQVSAGYVRASRPTSDQT